MNTTDTIPKRPSIYLTDHTQQILIRNLSGGYDSISGEINRLLISYDHLLSQIPINLTESEWSAIFDANNGCMIDPMSATMLWANVYDAPDYSEKWGVDNKQLCAKMQAMHPAALYRIGELNRMFWNDIDQTVPELLTKHNLTPTHPTTHAS